MDDERTERIDLAGDAGNADPVIEMPLGPEAPEAPEALEPPPPPPPGIGPPLEPPPPPPVAWAGAPQPWGAPPRASLDIGSIVGRTFDTYGREWSLFLALAIPAGLGGFASGALSQSFQAIVRDPAGAGNANPLPLILAQLIIAVLSAITTLATVVAADRLWRGQPVGLGDAVTAGLALIPRGLGLLLLVFALSLAIGIAMVVAVLVLVVLGPLGAILGFVGFFVLLAAVVFVAARLSLLLPVLALEHTPVTQVIGRTWQLTRGHALMLFLTAFVIGLCALLPTWGGSLFSLFVEDRTVAAIALGLATLVTAPLSAIWGVLAWGDLTGKLHHDSEVMATGRGRTTAILLVFGVGLVLLVIGGALAATGSAEFMRLYESR